MSKFISVLNLILKNWHFISSFGASILVFSKGIIEQIGWAVSIVLAYWAGLITLTLCGIAIFIYKYIKLYFSKQEVDKEERLSKIRIAENTANSNLEIKKEMAIATHNSTLEITKEVRLRTVNDIRENKQPTARQVSMVKFYAPELAECYKGEYDLSGDATCVVEEIFKEFKRDRPKINTLLSKVMKKLENKESVSLKLVTFINGITDGDLEIIKKQFSFVMDSGILMCDNIDEDFMIPNNLWATQIYDIKFLELWVNVKEKITIVDPGTGVLKKFLNYTFSVTNFATHMQSIDLFVCLSEIGFEFYNAIKDELDDMPIEYARKVVDYINKKSPSTLKAEIISVQANP
jgi:hypothetical protein